MAGIFGALNLADNDRVFQAVSGQQIIYDVATKWLAERNAELAAIISVFVERTTSDYTFRYQLPGGGTLQERDERSGYGNVKASGYWDVGFPLKDYGAAVGGDDVSMAYMTVEALDRHIQTVWGQNVRTVRFELLEALFNSAADTFSDKIHGNITIQPLANNDSVVYPPILGAIAEAAENHYLGALGYIASAISDTNNPFATIRDELEEHFGAGTGGENIVVFINSAQTAKATALTSFVEVPDQFVRAGTNTAVPIGLPNVPGRILGRCSGCWVVEWRWVPASYMLALHLDAPRPVIMRVDPADTGLPQGLTLVARDAQFPWENSVWRNRFGFGVGNRLNGVAMYVHTDAWAVPSGY
jgi:hypothetical protein